MKVLVMSDTHGRLDHAKMIIERLLPDHLNAILHCGDYINDMLSLKKSYPMIDIYGIAGNCDLFFGSGESDKLITLEKVPIFMTHGHKYDVKWGSYDSLIDDANAHDAKIAVCGHSHEAYIDKRDGILVINPGSLTLPRDSFHPSYALLELEEGKILNVNILQIMKDQTVRIHPVMKTFRKS